MSESNSLFRKILVSVLVFHLIFLLNIQSIYADQTTEGILAQSTVVFTPKITPVNATGTLQATVPSTILSPTAQPEPRSARIETSEGIITVGYDFVGGSDPPRWLIWFGEEGFFVSPDDVSTVALLDAFRDEVENIIEAKTAFENADENINDGYVSMFFEGLGVLGGGVTSVLSCGGVPLTFWLAGGTGWACAGGITATVGSGGAFKMTWDANKQARKDKIDAEKELNRATGEAEELFEALKNQNNS
jgi:hypothetical protein